MMDGNEIVVDMAPTEVAAAVERRLRVSAERAGSLLCVGLDPRPGALPPPEAAGEGRPCPERVGDYMEALMGVIADTGKRPAAFKPNIAFFHRLDRPLEGEFGGSRALARSINTARRLFPDVPIILDAKRGDIAATSAAYAAEAFDGWHADALTVAPYMGEDSVAPFLEHAARGAGWVYVLNRTSNPGARRIQNRLAPDLPLYRVVAEEIQRWHTRFGCAGAVIGATNNAELEELLGYHRVSPLPVLIPGVGSQGGEARETMETIRRAGYPPHLARVNVSRGIIAPWDHTPTAEGWRAVVRDRFLHFHEGLRWS